MMVLDVPDGLAAPPARIDGAALFLDVDGTLLDLRPIPDAVFAPSAVLRLLVHLQRRLGGAVALVSGRSLADLDRIFHPLRLPAAGVHGAEWRDPDGGLRCIKAQRAPLDAALPMLQRFACANPGSLVEDKSTALALHTRRIPQATNEALELVRAIAASTDGRYRAVGGKCVAELRPAGTHKGHAIANFMAVAPFAGRTPVMIGDDVTDEDGFHEVRKRGGLSIAVGPHAPRGDYRLANPRACRAWLAHSTDYSDRGALQ